jgi:hypothetical protein
MKVNKDRWDMVKLWYKADNSGSCVKHSLDLPWDHGRDARKKGIATIKVRYDESMNQGRCGFLREKLADLPDQIESKIGPWAYLNCWHASPLTYCSRTRRLGYGHIELVESMSLHATLIDAMPTLLSCCRVPNIANSVFVSLIIRSFSVYQDLTSAMQCSVATTYTHPACL